MNRNVRIPAEFPIFKLKVRDLAVESV